VGVQMTEPSKERLLRERHYPESKESGLTSVDGTMAFYARVRSLMDATKTVLDAGCGRGAGASDDVAVRREARDLRTTGAKVIGIDVDLAAASNPTIDEFRLIEGLPWPIESGSVDVCLSDYVMEHVEDPHAYLNEVRRVLVPGGYFCFRTPNIHSYFGILSRMTPGRMKKSVIRTGSASREEQDVFPAVYRFNTFKTVRRTLVRHGFDPELWGYEAEPSYLSFSKAAYAFGAWHQRHAPERWKLNIVGIAPKR
jgi:SAM-dependent methyltransferase